MFSIQKSVKFRKKLKLFDPLVFNICVTNFENSVLRKTILKFYRLI